MGQVLIEINRFFELYKVCSYCGRYAPKSVIKEEMSMVVNIDLGRAIGEY